jgi:hypothetical protein
MAYSPGGHGCRRGGRLVKGEGVSRFGDPVMLDMKDQVISPRLPLRCLTIQPSLGCWTSKVDSPPTIVRNIEEENGKLIG